MKFNNLPWCAIRAQSKTEKVQRGMSQSENNINKNKKKFKDYHKKIEMGQAVLEKV